MKRLIAIAALGLAISFASLGSGVAISAPKPLCTCNLSFASLGSGAAIQREGSQRTSSSASDYMDLYTKPKARSEVKDEMKSGNVEKDFTSFYTSPKTMNTSTSLILDRESGDQYVSVFSVRIAR